MGVGEAAWHAVESDPSLVMVFTDLDMPKLDGYAVVMAIRQREQAMGGHLPVIALTASVSRPLKVDFDAVLIKDNHIVAAGGVGAAVAAGGAALSEQYGVDESQITIETVSPTGKPSVITITARLTI